MHCLLAFSAKFKPPTAQPVKEIHKWNLEPSAARRVRMSLWTLRLTAGRVWSFTVKEISWGRFDRRRTAETGLSRNPGRAAVNSGRDVECLATFQFANSRSSRDITGREEGGLPTRNSLDNLHCVALRRRRCLRCKKPSSQLSPVARLL